MKKSDVELIIDTLKDLKAITDRLDFNTTTRANQKIMSILPIMEAEYKRLEEDKIELNGPKLTIIGTSDVPDTKMKLTDYVNKVLEDLVNSGYKIVDYGITNDIASSNMYVYIKYTD